MTETLTLSIPSFLKFISGIKQVAKYATINFTPLGYTCDCINVSGFYMGYLTVISGDNSTTVSLNVDIEKILSILPAKDSGKLTLTHTDGQLLFTLNKSKYKMSTVVKAEIPNCKPLNTKFTTGNNFTVDSKDLYDSIKSIVEFADLQEIWFKVSTNLLTLYDPDESAIREIPITTSIDEGVVYTSKFSGELVLPISEYFKKNSSKIVCNVLTDYPLGIWDSDSIFIVAPMITGDD